MPIYEYRCAACGHQLEALQKISEGPLRKCPECKKLKLQRLMSAPSFRLKGGGWYETDFKSDGEKKRNLVESSEAPPKERAAEAKDGAGDKTKTEGAKQDAVKPAPKDTGPAAKDKTKRAPKSASAGSADG
jgi:putative FmdB family regulatory protein